MSLATAGPRQQLAPLPTALKRECRESKWSLSYLNEAHIEFTAFHKTTKKASGDAVPLRLLLTTAPPGGQLSVLDMS